jgi:membrane dipeptidase
MSRIHYGSVMLLSLVMGVSLWSQQDRIAEQSRKLHASALVLDTHIDIPNLLRPDWNFTDEHREDHVDLPRLRKGGLDAVFMSIYMSGTVTGPQAVNDALELIAAVHKLAEDLPAEISLCTTADEVRRAHREGKVAVLLGMEGGHMINSSLPILRTYARLGVRYVTLTHSVNTDWADSSGDQPKHKGLTEFGRRVVRELNRLGVMVDISHVADTTFWNALEISRAPMIASHSSSRVIAQHHRNMTDEMMKALAAKGGVIQINYAVQFLDDARAQYSLRIADRQRALERQFPGSQNVNRRQAEIVREFGSAPQVPWEKIVEHIDHVAKLVGPDHVGLGSDFDGATMPVGMEDVTQLPKITEALLRRHYSEADIRKILGENTLRLMADVERVSAQIKTSERKPTPQRR